MSNDQQDEISSRFTTVQSLSETMTIFTNKHWDYWVIPVNTVVYEEDFIKKRGRCLSFLQQSTAFSQDIINSSITVANY